jgi:colanic acid biosynthesis glycosyl transferase WcaI
VKPLRIIFLTQWFDPEPALKGLSFAQGLAALGHQVEVVTGFPNYPGGKVYDGYRIKPIKREKHGAVDVTRLALLPSHSQSKIGRIANYLSFWFTSFLYLLFFAKRADVVYVYHPPMTVGLAAAMARLFRRTPTVLDIQDMWPDTLRATGMIGSPRILRIVGAVSRWVYRHVDRITVISPGFGKLLRERGVPADKIDVVMNWAPDIPMKQVAGADLPFRPEHDFRVLFAGNMGSAQGLQTVLQAAMHVQALRPNVGFYFLGSGISVEELLTETQSLGLTNVVFLPRVGFGDVGAYLQAADVLLVKLANDPLFAITIPSKTQAYLAAGKPIIMAVAGDAAELVKRANAGVVVPPDDAVALGDAVLALANMPTASRQQLGRNAVSFYTEELSLEQALNRLEDIFVRSMSGKQGSGL